MLEGKRWWTLALGAVLGLAAVLRLWGLAMGPPVPHPDEIFLVYFPLGFFGGNLNPHHFTYPSLQFYLFGALFYVSFLWQKLFGAGWSLDQFVVYHYFWDAGGLYSLARLAGVAFALGTVWWVGLLAGRVYGRTAGLVASLLVAVCAVHVRQSGLAAVDVPMTFWFVGAVWAAVRLLEREDWKDYVLAGVLVGLAGGTKYPGVLVCGTTVAAHLLAGRKPWDRRLWLAGAAAAGTFACVSPYVFLDWATFKSHFAYQVGHLEKGRDDLGRAWWYHLKVSLRYGLGWVGLVLVAVSAAQAVRQRHRTALVVLAGLLTYYLVMGAGRLVFVRYALPLLALQAILVAGIVPSLRRPRWQVAVVALAVLEPLYGSVRIAQLLGSKDTRVQAREWMEANIPAGTTCCNFGGWAGDVPVRTFEDMAWRASYYDKGFAPERLDRQLAFLEANKPPSRFYSYAVQYGRRQQAGGDVGVTREQRCAYVILHRHPLSYSTIDTSYAARLARTADLMVRFVPAGLRESDPQYDPIDAYYVPLGGFGFLSQAGPEIEVWRSQSIRPPPDRIWTAGEILAMGYAREAGSIANRPAKARALAQRAAELGPTAAAAQNEIGLVYGRLDEYDQAVGCWTAAVGLDPSFDPAYHNLGLAYRYLKKPALAVDAWKRAMELQPRDPVVRTEMGILYNSLGQRRASAECLRQAIGLNPDDEVALYNLGVTYHDDGQYDRAIASWARAVELKPDYRDAFFNLGVAYQGIGDHDQAIANLRRAADLQPDGEAFFAMGLSQYEVRRFEEALKSWQRSSELGYAAGELQVYMANAYLGLGRWQTAREHFTRALESSTDPAQIAEIRRFLAEHP